MENEQNYYHRWISINQHLSVLLRNYRLGNMSFVQNTFQYIRQEWLYQDDLAESFENRLIRRNHFSSQKLHKLDSLLSNEPQNLHFTKSNRQVILEIKWISDQMDGMLHHLQKKSVCLQPVKI
ncbi:hypothetical protein DSL64_19970 [Dyadobacter luteus]|uniref:Uncharacterized protein n=1 Tax=Dyadobacter luteus TaxID=2259619 RepID=A0A3D8YA54_9BACT|nr:hypothetical protein [Dyadobacter luteus]REA58645.1 hypothetical protein DSL64_19970 [Dyadobacter luteus]